ncbi:unnamed protein product, partial [Closterium sp. NIES-54]
MDVARTSMIHAAAPHFLWPFAVQYAAHQLNLHPRVSVPETSPTLRWTGKVGDASAFRVWGSRAFVRDLSADKLSPRAVPCVFLGFPPDAPGWQFYHPTSRCVLSSQDVTFDDSVPYYRLFPYRTAPLPPPPLFLVPGPPQVDPLPPQGPAPSGVSQVDAVEPVEVAGDSGTGSGGAEPGGAGSGGAEPGGAESRGAEPGGAVVTVRVVEVFIAVEVVVPRSQPVWSWGPSREGPSRGGPSRGGPSPPQVDPLPPQGPAPSGVSQVDAVEPVEVAGDSGTGSGGAEPGGAGSGGAEPGGAESGGAEPGGAESEGAEPGGAEPGSAEPGVEEPGGAGSTRVASRSASSRRELLSPQELREWFARRWSRAAGAGVTSGAAGTGSAAAAAGVGPAGTSRAAGAGAASGAGAGVYSAGGTAGAAGGTGAAGPAGVGAAGASGAPGAGAAEVFALVVLPTLVRLRVLELTLLELEVLGLPPSSGPAPSIECPQPVQSLSLLPPVSPLPAPSPYTGPTGGLAERREPASRPASPVRAARTSGPAPRQRPPAVSRTHQMTLRPSTESQRVPLPSPPAPSLPVLPDPESDSLRAASPTVARLLSTVVTDPSFESYAASALVAELVDFAACCRLDYAAGLVAESASVCPPSVG